MAHIHDLIDFTVSCYIVRDNRVVLIHHKKLEQWLSVGGHIELDEDPEEALIREVKEETGLNIKVYGTKPANASEGVKFLYCPVYLDIHNISSSHRHIGLVYFATCRSAKLKLSQNEHTDIRWFTKTELMDPRFKIPTNVKFYAEKALDKLTRSA